MVGIAVEAALFLGFSLHSVIVSSHEVPPAGPVGLNEVELCRGGPPPLSSLPKVFELFSFFFFYLFSFLSLFFPRAGGRFKEKDEI